MSVSENSAAMDAFKALCDELEMSSLVGSEECQYWVFERGYRAAVEDFIKIMQTGQQVKKFGSPTLQAIADKLMQ